MRPDTFVYDVRPKKGRAPRSLTCVHINGKSHTPERIADAVKQHFEESLPTTALLLIGLKAHQAQLEKMLTSEKLRDRLPIQMRAGVMAALLEPGNVWTMLPYSSPQDDDSWGSLIAEQFGTVLQSGLQKIVGNRNCVLKAERGFHYAKPSRKHSNYFIRGANLLVRGSEIDFIAFCASRYIQRNPSRICTDTSSINSVAYALCRLLSDVFPDQPPPDIDSFGSYAKYSDYPFPPHSLVLMSATTTNELAKEITSRSSNPPVGFVTLIGPSGRRTEEMSTLITLEEVGAEAVTNYTERNCLYCQRGSTPIHIRDEHFLPFTPHTRAEVLTEDHAKKWLFDICSALIGLEAIRIFPVISRFGSPQNLYIDVGELLKSSKGVDYRHRLTNLIHHHLPASLTTVIFPDDDASRTMAEMCLDIAKKAIRSDIGLQLLSASALFRKRDFDDIQGTVVVVCSVVHTGSTLTKISLMLRNAKKKAGVQYLTFFTRMPSSVDRQRVIADLTYGTRPGEYNFQSVESLYLPTSPQSEWSVWEQEADFLRRRLNDDSGLDEHARVVIGRRLEILSSAEQRGMLNDLFWEDAHRRPLKVRPGFAFWPKRDVPHIGDSSQADVYFTVLAVLHQARSGPDVSARKGSVDESARVEPVWVQTEHQRVVLSPYNFARYNDGVIQASLLRAAHQRELDYSYSVESSRAFAEIVKQLWDSHDREAGEALDEFLLALAMERVQLDENSKEVLIQFLTSAAETEGESVKDSTACLLRLLQAKRLAT